MTPVNIRILAIGRNAEILNTVVRLINNHPGWEGAGALTDKEAIQHFDHQVFDAVLLCGGILPTSEANLRNYFTAHRPQTPIIQHYGGGSGLLTAEIFEALKANGTKLP